MPLTWLLHFIRAPWRWWEVMGVGMEPPLLEEMLILIQNDFASPWAAGLICTAPEQFLCLVSLCQRSYLPAVSVVIIRHLGKPPGAASSARVPGPHPAARINSRACPGQRSPVLQGPQGGSRETAFSPFPDNLQGNCDRKNRTCSWEKIWKVVKHFFFLLIHNPALREVEIVAISVYQVDSYEIADNWSFCNLQKKVSCGLTFPPIFSVMNINAFLDTKLKWDYMCMCVHFKNLPFIMKY